MTHSLAVLARITLAHGNQWAKREPTDADVARLDNWVRQLPAFIGINPLGSRPYGTNIEAAYETFFQLSYDQFPLQRRDGWLGIGRALLLFEKIPQILHGEGVKLPIEINDAFMEISGMTMREFMMTGCRIYKMAKDKQGGLMQISEMHRFFDNDLPSIWRGDESDRPTARSLDKFLQIAARDCNEFRRAIGDLMTDDERFVRVEKWPLPTYPIIRIGRDEILAPIPKMLLDRVSTGIFHDLANHFAGQGVSNKFRSYFGRIFERYIGYHLELVFPKEYLIPETKYRASKQNRSTPDWTVNSPDGAIMIECRSSLFTLDARRFADMPRIVSDLERIGADPLRKGVQKINELKMDNAAFPLKSTADVRFGICTFERLEPLNLYGILLADQIPTELAEGFLFHIAPLGELERICALRDPSLFVQAIDVLTFDESWRDPFHSVQKRLDEVIPKHPESFIVREASDNFFRECLGWEPGSALDS